MQRLWVVGWAERDCEAIVGTQVIIIPKGDDRTRAVWIAAAVIVTAVGHIAVAIWYYSTQLLCESVLEADSTMVSKARSTMAGFMNQIKFYNSNHSKNSNIMIGIIKNHAIPLTDITHPFELSRSWHLSLRSTALKDSPQVFLRILVENLYVFESTFRYLADFALSSFRGIEKGPSNFYCDSAKTLIFLH